ncbi:MAG: NAD(P)H-dependent oxidoreductase, partial [Bacteroidota bacterium]|nr:NAD(P)H-dependent oxidoreductase [Bacteroidota bacterium]
MKKILIINGHPNKESYNFALHSKYKQGAFRSDGEIKEIITTELKFNLILQYGYSKRTELETDLLEAWKKVQWADHIVWIFPMWWGMMPALLKGFIDRMFLPGFAFQYKENSPMWDKLLKGKTSHILCTIDYPVWYYKWVLREPGINAMKKMILGFCGIKTTKVTYIGPVRGSSQMQREEW